MKFSQRMGVTALIIGLLSAVAFVGADDKPVAVPTPAATVPTPAPAQHGVAAVDTAIPPELSLPPNEFIPQVKADVEINAARDIGYGAKVVKAPEAWQKNTKARGAKIRVAVLDTGCQVDHPWLKDRIVGSYNAIRKTRDVTDGHGHGTHCNGIVAESLPDCELFPIKVLSDSGSGSVVDIAHGIDYAVSEAKADVISLSLGGGGSDSYIPPAFARAEAAGVIISCAAGNEGPNPNTDGYPARYPQAISVAATDENNRVANFSSRGASVFVATPGVNIVSSLPGNKSGKMSGTSMATPLHSALAGIWCATNDVAKTARPAAYRIALKMACQHSTDRTTSDGYGIPDATKLFAGGTPTDPPIPPPAPGTPWTSTIGWNDLSAAKQAELKSAGLSAFTLNLGGTGVIVAPTPTPQPPAPVPVQPAPVAPSACYWNGAGWTCPKSQAVPVQSSGWYPGKLLGR